MARNVVSEIVLDDDADEPLEEVTIKFEHWYGDMAYEMMLDDYICMSREQAIELRDKITEAL